MLVDTEKYSIETNERNWKAISLGDIQELSIHMLSLKDEVKKILGYTEQKNTQLQAQGREFLVKDLGYSQQCFLLTWIQEQEKNICTEDIFAGALHKALQKRENEKRKIAAEKVFSVQKNMNLSITEITKSVASKPCGPTGKIPLFSRKDIEIYEKLAQRKDISNTLVDIDTFGKVEMCVEKSYAEYFNGTKICVKEEIGSGGFGKVYRAVLSVEDVNTRMQLQEKFGEALEIAIKVEERTNNEPITHTTGFCVSQFLQKSESFHKKNALVNIFGVGHLGGKKHVSFMEYIPGKNLATAILENSLTTLDQYNVATQLLRILNEIMKNEVYLKDVKPKNIMLLPSGEIKLIDIDQCYIDKSLEQRSALGCSENPQGATHGTPMYMSADHIKKKFHAYNNIFSWMVSAVELFTQKSFTSYRGTIEKYFHNVRAGNVEIENFSSLPSSLQELFGNMFELYNCMAQEPENIQDKLEKFGNYVGNTFSFLVGYLEIQKNALSQKKSILEQFQNIDTRHIENVLTALDFDPSEIVRITRTVKILYEKSQNKNEQTLFTDCNAQEIYYIFLACIIQEKKHIPHDSEMLSPAYWYALKNRESQLV